MNIQLSRLYGDTGTDLARRTAPLIQTLHELIENFAAMIANSNRLFGTLMLDAPTATLEARFSRDSSQVDLSGPATGDGGYAPAAIWSAPSLCWNGATPKTK